MSLSVSHHPFQELLAGSNGYIANDSVQLEVQMCMEPPRSLNNFLSKFPHILRFYVAPRTYVYVLWFF